MILPLPRNTVVSSTWLPQTLKRTWYQFFDPKHHYFTFPDYQLVPTTEEFYKLLGVPILDQIPFTGIEKDLILEKISRALHLQRSGDMANWEMRSGVKGFLAKFLFEKV